MAHYVISLRFAFNMYKSFVAMSYLSVFAKNAKYGSQLHESKLTGLTVKCLEDTKTSLIASAFATLAYLVYLSN